MYNGVGIATPRGSGSNGNVQKNLSSITCKSKHKNDSRKPKSLDVITIGKLNEDIIEHDKKRKIELKCLEFQQTLEDRGYSESEVFDRVSSYRKSILELMLTENKHGQIVTKERQEITEAQQRKNEKLHQAFGISDNFVDGSSFYPESRVEKTGDEVKRSSRISSSPTSNGEVISMPSRKRSRKSSLSSAETKKKKKKKKKHKRKHVPPEDKNKAKNHSRRSEKYSSPEEVESVKRSKYSHRHESSELVKKHSYSHKKSSSKHKSSSKDRRIPIKDRTKSIDHRTRSRDNTPAKEDDAIRNKKSSLESPRPEKPAYDKHSKIKTPVVKKWKSKKKSKKCYESRGRSSSSNYCSDSIQIRSQESSSHHRSETPPVILKSCNQSDANSNSRNSTWTRPLSKIKHSPFRRSTSVEPTDGSNLTPNQKSQSPVCLPDDDHMPENETNLGEYSSVFTKLTLCRNISAAEKCKSNSSCRRTAPSSLHLTATNLEQEETYPSSFKSKILKHNSNIEKHSDESSPLKYSPVDRSPDRYTDILIVEHTKETKIESAQKTTFTKSFDATKSSPVVTHGPQSIEKLQDKTTNTSNKENSQKVSDTDSLEDFASVMIDEAVKKTASALQVNREKTLESLKKLLSTSIETNEEKRKKYRSSSRSAPWSKKEKKSNSRSRWFSDSSRSSRSRSSSLSSTSGRSTNSRATSNSDRNSKKSSRSFSRIVLNKRKRDSRSESSSMTRSPRSASYDSYDSGRFRFSRSRSDSVCKKKRKRHLCQRGRASGSDSTLTRGSSNSSSKSRSRSLSIPRRKGSPSFLERRRITR